MNQDTSQITSGNIRVVGHSQMGSLCHRMRLLAFELVKTGSLLYTPNLSVIIIGC